MMMRQTSHVIQDPVGDFGKNIADHFAILNAKSKSSRTAEGTAIHGSSVFISGRRRRPQTVKGQRTPALWATVKGRVRSAS